MASQRTRSGAADRGAQHQGSAQRKQSGKHPLKGAPRGQDSGNAKNSDRTQRSEGRKSASRKPAPRKATPQNSAPRKAPARSAHDQAHATAGPCPIMHACGGCSLLGVPYHKQLKNKQTATEELFAPLLAQFGWDCGIEPVRGMRYPLERSPEDVSYDPLRDACVTADAGKLPAPRAFRHKAATPFAPGPHGSVQSGFFAAGTHRIVATPDCPVEAPGARRILNAVARVAEDLHITAFDEDAHRGLLRHAIVRMGWRTNEALLTVVTSNRDLPREQEFAEALAAIDPALVGVAHNINPRPGNAILGPETRILTGSPRMHDRLLGCTFAISPTAFYQTNPQQTEVLYSLAIEGMDLAAGDVVLDAYCGSGTIGLTAAEASALQGAPISLVGVERNPAGVADAQENAQLNHIDATFVAEDATSYIKRCARDGMKADVVVLDPPRAGSTPTFLQAVSALGPRRVVYVSCNPATQVRDLAILGQAGYRLVRLTPVDMFPHTSHVETVAVLER